MTPRLVGMVHLGPLPGAPRYRGDLDAVITAAVADARTLIDAGFDGLMVENFGDAPFFADDAPKETIAAMTRVVGAVTALGAPTGVNVLRNDALGALAVAAASGAAFIRVNVLSGVMYTDQGVITGKGAELQHHMAQLVDYLRAAIPALFESEEYRAKADLWPLNPDGELIAIAMIESREALKNKPGNLPAVTGARGPRVLGAIYPA